MPLSEWKETTLGEFSPFIYGKGLPERDRVKNGNIPVYGSNGIVGKHDKAYVNNSGIIIGRKGTIGSVHLCRRPFCPIDTSFYIEDEPQKRDLFYTYYLLKTLPLKNNNDSAVPGLNRDYAHNLIITVPDIPEQQAIAEVLGSLDDKIELNRKMNKILEDMAQAIFKSWFVDFDPVRAKAEGRTIEGLSREIIDLFPDSFEESELGDIPKGWNIKKTSELFEVKDGTHASPKQTETGHYLITSKHIIGDTIDYKTAKLISEKDFEEVNKRSKVDKLDILITMIGTVGNPFIVQQDNIDFAIKNIGLFKTSQNKELAYYLYLLLKSKNMQDYIISKLAGTTQAYITLGELRSLPILYDKKIINKFNEITQSIFIKIQANNEDTQTLLTMRDTLLPKLISGELRIPDAEKLVEGVV